MAVVIAAVLLGGCASKSKTPLTVGALGPGVPSATVRNTAGWAFSTYLVSVDGMPVRYKRALFGSDTATSVMVPAGVHEVKVNVASAHVTYIWWFGHDFVAGHTYRFDHAGAFDQRVRVFDETTGTSQVIKTRKK